MRMQRPRHIETPICPDKRYLLTYLPTCEKMSLKYMLAWLGSPVTVYSGFIEYFEISRKISRAYVGQA